MLVVEASLWRVVRVEDTAFPAYYRLIWKAHEAEFSDLTSAHRVECLQTLGEVELALRALLNPTKVNLAALGNMVPHLHWHVVARFDWDSHFPQPIWGVRQREPQEARLAQLTSLLPQVDAEVRRRCVALLP